MSKFQRRSPSKQTVEQQHYYINKKNQKLHSDASSGQNFESNKPILAEKQKGMILISDNPQFEQGGSGFHELSPLMESPVARFERMQLQQIQNKQQQAQNRLIRVNQIRNTHWDDSFKSLLKSNQNYRRELLSAYEEKAKMQMERSFIQKQFVGLELQNEQLVTENKEMHGKLAILSKNLASAKEEGRKRTIELESEVNRLKHEIKLCNIDREELNKANLQILATCKDQQLKLKQKQDSFAQLKDKNEELQGQITFLMGKINESEEEYFILEQSFKNANQSINNLQIKLKRALEESSKHLSTIIAREKELNEQKIMSSEQLDDRDSVIEQKMREMNRQLIKIRDLSDQIAYLHQQNDNLRELNSSLYFLEAQNQKLRDLSLVIEDLRHQNEKIAKENIVLKGQKEQIHELFKNKHVLLDEISKEYEQFIKISKTKEIEDQHSYGEQLRKLTLRVNELETEVSIERNRSSLLLKEIAEKEREANYNTEIIQKLQSLTEQKIEIIHKHTNEEKKLKEFAEHKVEETKENKKVIHNLAETFKSQKQRWEHIANTNKALLDEREKNIEALNKHFQDYKQEKNQRQAQYKDAIKKGEEKIRLNIKQFELLREKISQLQESQRQMLNKIQNKQQTIAKLQESTKSLTLDLKLGQDSHARLQEQVKKLEAERQAGKQRESQLNRSLAQKESTIHEKTAKIEDMQLEMEQLKKMRQNDYIIHEAESRLKVYERSREDFEDRYNRCQQTLKMIGRQLSAYRTSIMELRNFNFTMFQKLANSLNSTQKYSLLREVEKISQLTNKLSAFTNKIDKVIEAIRDAADVKEFNRQNIIIKEGNMYKLNRQYRE